MSYLGTTKIGKMWLGSTGIGKAYLGSDLVFQQGGAPVGTPVNYIRGGADGSYIDTGITPDDTVKVIVWARNWNPSSYFLFGSRTSSGVDGFGLCAAGTTGIGAIRIDFAQGVGTNILDQFKYLSGYHKYELYDGVLKVDDVTVGSESQDTFSNSYNIHLLGNNNGGTHGNMSLPADICACQIYKNGVLVRDFTPAESPSVGLYDAVSDTVFTNAGNGSLTFGTFTDGIYTQLEYINSAGDSYIDTGIKGSDTLPFIAVCTPQVPKGTPWVLGAQTNRSYQKYGLGFGDASTAGKYMYFYWNNTNTTHTSDNTLNGSECVVTKVGRAYTLYIGGTQIATKSGQNATFTTAYNLFIGACNNAGTVDFKYTGRIHYANFGADANFMPAKKGNKVGMLETYSDTFYPSASQTPFTEPSI